MENYQVIPTDITNLPKYAVPREQFICTTIILIIFLIITLVNMLVWIWRIYKRIFNPDYIIDFEVKYQTVKALQMDIREFQQNKQFQKKQLNIDDIPSFTKYNRQENRFLELMCLSVVIAINIGTFTCNIMLTVTFVVSLILFLIFNILRILDSIKLLRILWLIPLLAAAITYYIFENKLETQ